MAAKDELPGFVQKVSSSLPAEAHAALLDLYKTYNFKEDHLECFFINSAKSMLTVDNLPDFRHHLADEASKKTGKASKPGQTGTQPTPARSGGKLGGGIAGLLGGKRALPAGVNAALSQAQASASASQASQQDLTTPDAKRPRGSDMGGVAAGATPEPPSKVSVKSSVNENLKKPEQGSSVAAAAQIRLLGDRSLWMGKNGGAYRWMDESIEDRATAQDEALSAMEGPILAAVRARPAARLSLGEGETEVAAGTVGVASQAEVVLCGRLICEGLEGRLNERSILLEGSRLSCNSARVQLNLSGCPHIAAFPGQIVGVLGRSGMSGSTFHARDFVAGLPPRMPRAAPSADAQLHMMVAAGPFCLRDSLDYSPLEQVLAHAVRMKPRVLLLIGPLLDAGNLKVSSGDTVIPGETEPRSYEEVYTEHLFKVLARGIRPLRQAQPPTEVLLVPSLEEALCFHPLPQPPLDISLNLQSEAFSLLKNNLGAKLLPNPAHLEINGLRVSTASADALSPVLRELVLRPPERKIEEALRLLLSQRTLFPVVPRDPAQVSEARAGALAFPFADGALPDLCIFPSAAGGATGTFVDGTAFVNPGLLCRGTLGTFAEIMVLPDRAAQGGNPLKLSERARVDILKLGQ
jgi:DNA polymerase alpha subunit B